MIESQWLKDQIVRFEFVPEDKFQEFSNVSNYKALFECRKPIFVDAYTKYRQEILNN